VYKSKEPDAMQLKVLRKLTLIGHGAQGLSCELEKGTEPIFNKSKKEICESPVCGKIMEQVLLKAISSHKKRKKKSDREKAMSSWWPVASGTSQGLILHL